MPDGRTIWRKRFRRRSSRRPTTPIESRFTARRANPRARWRIEIPDTMLREMTIGSTRITDESDCYVIAEIGHNHQGSVEKAKEMFRAAKECGVDAVKLQKRSNR